MWPIEGIRRRRAVRNAITLLEAGGYVVSIEPDHIRFHSRRVGRTWNCYTAAEFFEASAFHAWETFSQAGDTTRPSVPLPLGVEVPVSSAMAGGISEGENCHPWTARLFRDQALRLAIRRFYEKGYRLDIRSGTVGYLDRNGAYHECLSRSELLIAAERCGREAEPSKVRPIGTATVIPFAGPRERGDQVQNAARVPSDMQAPRLSQYERLKQLVLEEFDPRHSKAVGIEKVLRAELFRTLEPRIREIDDGVDTDENRPTASRKPTA